MALKLPCLGFPSTSTLRSSSSYSKVFMASAVRSNSSYLKIVGISPGIRPLPQAGAYRNGMVAMKMLALVCACEPITSLLPHVLQREFQFANGRLSFNVDVGEVGGICRLILFFWLYADSVGNS
ncbi:hypothetical protein ACLOJK_011732 [Asimina triloba]